MELPLGAGPRALRKENPLPPSVNTLGYNLSRDLLVAGLDDGSLTLRSLANPDFFARILMHDGDRGHLNAAATSHDDTFVLSVGSDGLLVVYNLKKGQMVEEAKTRAATAARAIQESLEEQDGYVFKKEDAEEGSTEVISGFPKVESSTKSPNETIPDPAATKAELPDILDTGAYSIQDAKLKVGQKLV